MNAASGGADGIAIRLATRRDARTLHALILQLAAATGLPGKVTSRPEDLMRHAGAFEALLAERHDTALGFCLFFYSFSSWRGEPGVYVQDLYVAEAARGSGLGRALLLETVRHARSRGAAWLRLSVERDNRAAQDFYRKMGLSHAANECIWQVAGEAFERLGSEWNEETGH